jgi:hypothetical protein
MYGTCRPHLEDGVLGGWVDVVGGAWSDVPGRRAAA